MSQTQSLFPVNALTFAVSATSTASASAALASSGDSIMFFNEGPNNAWVSVGTGSQTATLPGANAAAATRTCTPIAAGAYLVWGCPEDLTNKPPVPLNISAITRTGTAVINVAVNRGC